MVLMMGTREEDVPSEPTVKPVFVEDMNMAELASAVSNFAAYSKAFKSFFSLALVIFEFTL